MAAILQLLDDDSDATPLDLAEDGDTVSDLRINGQQAVQMIGAVRAANTRAKGRQNVGNRITVGVKYAPESTPAEAQQAAAALVVAIRDKLATATLVDLILLAHFRLSDATLETYDIHPSGTTVHALFNFIGGSFAEVEE